MFKVGFVLIPLLLFSDQLLAKESKLLILGDSLSAAYGITQQEGWVSLLQDMWNDKPISIVNAAISGETTDGALARLPRLLQQNKPTHIYIEIGGNDALQGHPISKTKQNLEQLIRLSKEHDAIVLLQAMQIPPNYGRRYTEMFSNIYKNLADEFNIKLIPFFIETIATNSDYMQQDGIHPNAKAQLLIAQDMAKQLNDALFSGASTN